METYNAKIKEHNKLVDGYPPRNLLRLRLIPIWIASAARWWVLLPTGIPPAIPLWIPQLRCLARCPPRHWGSCRRPRQAPAGGQRAVYDFYFSCKTTPFKTKKGPCIHQKKTNAGAGKNIYMISRGCYFYRECKKPRLADLSRSTNRGFKLCEY